MIRRICADELDQPIELDATDSVEHMQGGDRLRYSVIETHGAEGNRRVIERRSHATRPRLSLVIPAYNESKRISDTVNAAAAYLEGTGLTWELIVVDDGSTDGTASNARSAAVGHARIEVLSIAHAGKAAALRAGMTAAAGELIAFTDADLATPLHYLQSFITHIDDGADVVIGSREGSGARRIGEPGYRHAMGRVFNRLVQLATLPGIEDSQCGFKLFRAHELDQILAVARLYRDPQTVNGARVTAFDVELLAIARRWGLRIDVLPVVWTYGSQSKVNPLKDSWANVADVAKVTWNLRTGRYARVPGTKGPG